MTSPPTTTYAFTLILDGISDLTKDAMDAVYEAGFDDALLGMSGGVAFLDMEREAATAREAVISAVAQVRQIGRGIRVVRVEPAEYLPDAELQELCAILAAASAT